LEGLLPFICQSFFDDAAKILQVERSFGQILDIIGTIKN